MFIELTLKSEQEEYVREVRKGERGRRRKGERKEGREKGREKRERGTEGGKGGRERRKKEREGGREVRKGRKKKGWLEKEG